MAPRTAPRAHAAPPLFRADLSFAITRFPDLQAAAGSYNAKREYLAAVVARQIGIRRFDSQTHVMAGLWSAEVIHSVRLRSATFQVLCPDPDERLVAWLHGAPPASGSSSSFVLLDPFATGRQSPITSLQRLLAGAKPRVRDYRAAADRLRARGQLHAGGPWLSRGRG